MRSTKDLCFAAGMSIACMARAQTPRSIIPRELAEAIVHGNTRMVIVGDSLSVNSMGDPGGAAHCPLPVGIARTWQPERWHGVYSQPAWPNGGFSSLRGIGASAYDQTDSEDRTIPVSLTAAWPGGLTGFGTEESLFIRYLAPTGQAWWNVRNTFRLFVSPAAGTAATRQLMQSPSLRARNIIYRNPGMAPMTDLIALMYKDVGAVHMSDLVSTGIDNSATGWTTVDFPIGVSLPASFNRATDDLRIDLMLRPVNQADATYITMGTLWEDPDSPGLQVHSIAQGGWNAVDHARLSAERGYSDLAIRENLRVMGFADPGVTRVVMITLGSNIGLGEADGNGPTSYFTDHIAQVMGRYRDALLDLGVSDTWFILVGMHSLDFPPDVMATGRAQLLHDLAVSRPRCGFFSVPAMLGLRGEGFRSSWYQHQAEAVLTQGAAQTETTLQVNSTAGFWLGNDQFYATDGVHQVRGTYWGLSPTTLLNVQMDGPLNAGARLMPGSLDIHFSRAGSEAVAGAMWGEIVAALGRFCEGDYNGDGDFGTDQDIEAFFRCLAGNCCAGCTPDFNNDGDSGTDQDIESFFRVLSGAAC